MCRAGESVLFNLNRYYKLLFLKIKYIVILKIISKI